MNLLIIQGPNLNLLGKKSSQVGECITLNKINKALRLRVRNQNITLKFLQTHKIERAITSLQRNRNWADGILIAPMAWAKFEYVLKETLQLIKLPVVEIFFNEAFFMGTGKIDSMLTETCVDSIEGLPEEVFTNGINRLIRHIQKPV